MEENKNLINWIKFLKVEKVSDLDDIEETCEEIRLAKQEYLKLAADPEVQKEYIKREEELKKQRKRK